MVVLAAAAEHFCAGGSVEVQSTNHDSRGEDGEKKTRDALGRLSKRIAASASIEKPKSFGSWLISTVSAMPFM
jgi:hypothetical protein